MKILLFHIAQSFTNRQIDEQMNCDIYEPRHEKNAKTKAQISCAVTAQLISAFDFATRIVHFLMYLYPNFQDSSFLL